jgi:phosphopantothenoylcysteine decarboxylase/phosphopantothenate--cysteine ligase
MAYLSSTYHLGAQIILITATTTLPDPVGVKVFKVQTAEEMREQVLEGCFEADALIMAAAVADYRPKEPVSQKRKKGAQAWTLELVPTQDIISQAPAGVVRIGFAAESDSLIKNAKAKVKAKDLDLIVANDITRTDSGFGTDANQVTLIDPEGNVEELPLLPKYDVAVHLLDRLRDILDARPRPSRVLP